mmetsp:Transcript_16373/g.26855  ORF Transcript_16373/g.26855 Transcript_16373/m.26855 type:complete len:342 (+) Transcript_16373:165-1190(+)
MKKMLQEVVLGKTLAHDDIFDGVKYKTDVLSVRGTGHVHVDDLALGAIQRDKLVLEVLDTLLVVASTTVVVKAALHVDAFDLLFKEIAFVEEEDDGGVAKPLAVANLVKERDGLVHAVDALVLVELHVVLTESDAEDERRDVLEAVDPLLALVSLASDVHHAPVDTAELERDFGDTGGSRARPQKIVLCWRVVGLGDAIDVVKEVSSRVDELVFTGPRDKFLDTSISPEDLDGLSDFGRHLLIVEDLLRLENLSVSGVVRRDGSDAETVFSGDDGTHCGNDVGVDDILEEGALLVGEALQVQDFHLLCESALSRVTGTKEEKLDFSVEITSFLAQHRVNLL